MSWFGKVFGGAFGFLMGGPLGAVLGATLGHRLDQGERGAFSAEVDSGEQYRTQMAFFSTAFSVMGHVAKADGRVNEMEIAHARQVMARLQLNDEMRRAAMRLFNEGKRHDYPLDGVLEHFRQECRRQFTLARSLVEFQIELALADGPVNLAEERLLLRICERLHYSRFEFHALKNVLESRWKSTGSAYRSPGEQAPARREPSLEDAYAVLGLRPSANDEDIRRAYQRLRSRHHPDKLSAQGMPEEQVRLANEKTHEIRKAWETIRKTRNL